MRVAMKRPVYLSLALGAGVLLVGAVRIGRAPNRPRTRAATAYARLPLHFEANRGQTDPQVKFLARGIGQALFLTQREAVLVLSQPDPAAQGAQIVLRMAFVGANPQARVGGLEPLPGKANYFVGRDPARWRSDVPLYATVRYHDLYPGIDLSWSGDQRHLAFTFLASPGADLNRIVLRWQGPDSLVVGEQGDLELHTAGGIVRQGKPVIYQELEGGAKQEIAGRYVRTGADQVGFEVAVYDTGRPLVIGVNATLSITAGR
jgi:hypothetical protein